MNNMKPSSQTINFDVPSGVLSMEDALQTIGSQLGMLQNNSCAIIGSELVVKVNPTSHTSGSSAIVTKTITNYAWDSIDTPGNLLASHCSGDYIAYAIKGPPAQVGMVRIMNRKSGERGLIKNIPGVVKDIAFAYMPVKVLLACVDEYGTLFVYEIHEVDNAIKPELKLHVMEPGAEPELNICWSVNEYNRVIWCPYIPEDPYEDTSNESNEDNLAYILAVTNGATAEIWHLGIVPENLNGPVSRSSVKAGYQLIQEHSAPITEAAFSPDGNAFATASLDGRVKFFQLHLVNEMLPPRCLHEWTPHDNKPISCLFFLDDYKQPNIDGLWKYAVTGADNNTELKVWSCENWICLQTVRFQYNSEMEGKRINGAPLTMKAAIDPSSKYIILSDTRRRLLYVLVLDQDMELCKLPTSNGVSADVADPKEKTTTAMKFISISELPIQFGAIYLEVTDAAYKPYKRWKHEYLHIHQEDGEEEGNNVDIIEGLVIQFFFITSKSLCEATIRFQPALPEEGMQTGKPECRDAFLNISSSQDSIVLRDGLTDMSLNISANLIDMEPTDVSHKHPAFPAISSIPISNPAPVSNHNSTESPTSVTAANMSLLESRSSEEIVGAPSKMSPSISTLLPSNASPQNVTMNLLTPDSFNSVCSPRVHEDEHNLLAGLGMVTPSITEILSRETSSIQNDDDVPLATSEVSPPTNIVSPTTKIGTQSSESPILPTVLAAVTSSGFFSSTSSPSLEIQQILHTENGKNEDFCDAEELEDDIELPITESTEEFSKMKIDSASRNLIDIVPTTGPFDLPQSKCESAGISIWEPHPPLVLHTSQSSLPGVLPSNNILRTNSMTSPQDNSLSKDTRGDELLQKLLHNLTDDLHSNVDQHENVDKNTSVRLPPKDILSDLNLVPPRFDSNDDANDSSASLSRSGSAEKIGPFQLKNLPSVSKHMTCAQLEAEIQKTPLTVLPKLNTKMSSEKISQDKLISKFTTIMPLRPNETIETLAILETNRIQTEAESHKKTMDEMKALQKLFTAKSKEQAEKTRLIMEQTKPLCNLVEKALKHIHQLNKQMDELRKSQNKSNDQVSQMFIAGVKPLIENAVRSEVKNSLYPAIYKCMESIKANINSEMRTILSFSEGHIADQLTKTIHSRNFIDNMSTSVNQAIGCSVQSATRECYNKVVIPGFQAVSQSSFAQMNEAFTRGTKEYMHHVETEAQSTRASLQENLSKGTRGLEAAATSLTANTTSLVETLSKSIAQHNGLTESLESRLRVLVREELAKGLQEHTLALEARRSRAHTPAAGAAHAPLNIKAAQQQIQTLISQQDFNGAFKQALMLSDLSLVVFVCERINPQQLFNHTTCPLSQDVLLSLINQLSHDLTTFTDLKIKYLEESVMTLDLTHPVTKEHVNKVLHDCQSSLANHLALNPNLKKLKMLLLAIKHLVSSST